MIYCLYRNKSDARIYIYDVPINFRWFNCWKKPFSGKYNYIFRYLNKFFTLVNLSSTFLDRFTNFVKKIRESVFIQNSLTCFTTKWPLWIQNTRTQIQKWFCTQNWYTKINMTQIWYDELNQWAFRVKKSQHEF